MTSPIDQGFEAYVPVYDTVPDKWEEAKPFLVEQFKRLANAINIREIGWFLDEELLSGKAFTQAANNTRDDGTSEQYRTILRKVIIFPGLTAGANTAPHGISVTTDFSLVQIFGAATNSTTLTGQPIPNGANTISYDATNIIINVAAAYDRAWAIIEYIQEL